MERNLTSGSVWKNIFYFSLPYLLSYFLQTLYGMADLFIIGQFEGVAGTTVVSIGSQVMHMLTVMIVGLAMGSTVSIAKAIGANDKKEVSRSIGNTVTLFMLVAAGLMVILLCLVHPIVSVMSTPAEAVSGEDSISADISGTAFLQGYSSVSVVISVHVADQNCRFCIISLRSCWCAYRVFILHRNCFRRRFFPWDWQPLQAHFCQ